MDAVAAAWDPEAYVALLGKLVGEAKHLQNGAGHTPTEDRGACWRAERAAGRGGRSRAPALGDSDSGSARRTLSACSTHTDARTRAAARHVLEALQPHSTAHGGPLIVRSVSYVEGRSNIIVELKGSDEGAGAVSFVGMHLDVVPANPGAQYAVLQLPCWQRRLKRLRCRRLGVSAFPAHAGGRRAPRARCH